MVRMVQEHKELDRLLCVYPPISLIVFSDFCRLINIAVFFFSPRDDLFSCPFTRLKMH